MSLFSRIKNLWELSKWEPARETLVDETGFAQPKVVLKPSARPMPNGQATILTEPVSMDDEVKPEKTND